MLSEIERDPGGDASASITCPTMPLGEQAGLADTRIPADQDRGRLSLRGYVQGVVERREFGGATHERKPRDANHHWIIGLGRRGSVGCCGVATGRRRRSCASSTIGVYHVKTGATHIANPVPAQAGTTLDPSRIASRATDPRTPSSREHLSLRNGPPGMGHGEASPTGRS